MPPSFDSGPWRRALIVVVGWLISATLIGACTSTDRSAASFCEQLQVVAGPTGAEVTVIPGDPGRIDAIVVELELLLDRSPDEIATTVSTLIDFFGDYQQASREDRRSVIVEREAELAAASTTLNDYALDECGVFLQRAAPTPIVTSDPGIEVAPE